MCTEVISISLIYIHFHSLFRFVRLYEAKQYKRHTFFGGFLIVLVYIVVAGTLDDRLDLRLKIPYMDGLFIVAG
jgi:hypothetical protein